MISQKFTQRTTITIILVIANLCLLVICLSAWTKPGAQNNKKTVIRPLTLAQERLSINNITEMEIRIHQVLFEDGTLFEAGALYRRNPDQNDPRKWIKIDN